MLKKKGLLQRSLDRIEFIGNKLPHPVTLFALLALLVLILSAILSQLGISVEHPGEEGKMVEITNLLNKEGIQYIFLSITDNFINFAPLGIVLVTMLGIRSEERRVGKEDKSCSTTKKNKKRSRKQRQD